MAYLDEHTSTSGDARIAKQLFFWKYTHIFGLSDLYTTVTGYDFSNLSWYDNLSYQAYVYASTNY